jgi:two-component system LytT family response regulator
MRALLIEDELPARQDLRGLLGAHPEVEIVGEAATVNTARTLLRGAVYELVFLDINLIGGSSFELVRDVRPGARIIFTTAYDAYAVRAFEVNAVDYLLKPIAAPRLAAAVARVTAPAPVADAKSAVGHSADSDQLLQFDDRVYLRAGDRGRFALVADISVITAEDNYSEVTLAGGDRLLLRKSLNAWESMLPSSHFTRVHRTCIANLAHVVEHIRQGDGALLTIKGVAEPVSVSRRTWGEVRARLAELHPQR